MLGHGLSLNTTRSGRWWPDNAVYAADFVNNRYMRNGVEIDRASALTFSRASAKLAEDSKGVWHHFGVDQPAITDRGLLLEPAATNLVANPTMAGAVPGIVGAGGALPTGWSTTNFSPVEVIDTGWEDGLPYITLRLRYTNGTGSTQYPCLIPVTGVPATLGEQWTASAFYKLLAGAWHPNTAAFLNVREAGTTQIYPSQSRTGDLTTRTRMALTWTTTRPGTITLELRALMFNVAPGETGEPVVRIYAPALAKEPTATSPAIEPGMTRAIDNLVVHLPSGVGQLTLVPFTGPDSTIAASPGGNAISAASATTLRRIVATP